MYENIGILIGIIAGIIAIYEFLVRRKKKLEEQERTPDSIPTPEPDQVTKPKKEQKTETTWNVPFRRNENFTGRVNEMKELNKVLNQESKAVINQLSQIKGMGGVGKTQLAVEYAYQNKEKYPGGILWVGGSLDVLGEYAKLADVLKLGLADNMPERDKCTQVQQCLNERKDKTLLVLDNQDDKEAYDEIRDYLPNIGNCRILITTRLKNLEEGEGLPLDILPDEDAVKLLITESSRDGDEETALKICRTLGNLPLAIEVAGKYLKKMNIITFEDYYNKLIDAGLSHPSLDTDETLHNVNHAASIKATLTIHKELMENDQIKKILTALTCFEPDSINPELLALVCSMDWEGDKEGVWELVTTLDNYSILEIQQGNRLNIHRLMQGALKEQIPDDDLKTMQQDYVTKLLGWFEENNDVTTLKVTTPEISHILEAAQIAQENNIWPQSYDFCIGLGKYYKFIGRFQQSLKWREKSEEKVKKQAPNDQEKLSLSYNEIGATWHWLRKYEKAIEFYQQALAIDRELYGEKGPDVAIDLNNIGEAWRELGKYEKAIEFYDQALDIWKEVYGEKHPQVAIGLNNLGSAWFSLEEYKKAIEFSEKALAINREIFGEKHPNIAYALNNLGGVWSSLKNYDKAREYFQQAYDMFVEFLGEDHPNTQIVKKHLDSLPS